MTQNDNHTHNISCTLYNILDKHFQKRFLIFKGTIIEVKILIK